MANDIKQSALYLVGTPIGNLSDFSVRAQKILSEVSFIAAEDTRVTGKLLSCFSIKKSVISYYEHNKRERGPEIISRLLSGESCALVTDAGMPAISDPGEDLVRLCAENNIPVFAVPGPCAAICALALSGISSLRFSFEGFLPTKKSELRERLNKIKDDERTLIFYEAPHRLRSTLESLAEFFPPERRISLAREITKLNEETLRLSISEAVEYYSVKEPRGEYVIVIEGAPDLPNADCQMSVREHFDQLLKEGMSENEAMKAVAKARGVGKSVIYKEIKIKG